MSAHFLERDPAVLLETMNKRLLAYWLAYFSLEPTIGERLDILLPKLTADVLNMLRDPESAPVQFDDVRIDWAADPQPVEDYTAQVTSAEADMANTILAAFGP